VKPSTPKRVTLCTTLGLFCLYPSLCASVCMNMCLLCFSCPTAEQRLLVSLPLFVFPNVMIYKQLEEPADVQRVNLFSLRSFCPHPLPHRGSSAPSPAQSITSAARGGEILLILPSSLQNRPRPPANECLMRRADRWPSPRPHVPPRCQCEMWLCP